MATLDASIYGQQRQVQWPDPVQQYGRLAQLQGALNQQDVQQMQMEEMRRSRAEEAQLRDLFAKSGGDVKAALPELYRAGLYKPAMAIEKQQQELIKSRADIGEKEAQSAKHRAETLKTNVAVMRDLIAQASSDADMPILKARATQLFGPDGAANIPDTYSPEWQQSRIADASHRLQQLTPVMKEVDQGGRKVFVDTNPITNPGIKGTQFDMTMTPGQVAVDERTREMNASIMRHQRAQEGIAAGQLGVARERLALDRVPSGYRRTEDGNLEAIPGGPAEAGKIPQGYRMNEAGTLEAIPGGPAALGKALPGPAVKDLSGAGAAVEDTRRLSGSFKPGYGGHTILGDMSNTYGRIFGDSTGQAQWWQDMDALQNQTRHALFGSALTKTELAAWEKTSITPRMNPTEIRKNLDRRQEIEARAASKLANAYTAAGYNKQQINELLGTAAEYVGQPAPPVSDKSTQPQQSFDRLPDPRQFTGKRMQASDGTILKSNGTTWVRE